MPHKDPTVRKAYARALMTRIRSAQQEERLADLEASRAQRPRLPDADYAWAAGMFEGDGTATITRAGRLGHSRTVVTLTSTDPEIVKFFQERWGGTIKAHQPSGRARLAHVWLIGGERIIEFLDDVLPYVRTTRRREVMTLVRESQHIRLRRKRTGPWTQRLKELHARVRVLNTRGTDHEPVLPAGSDRILLGD